MNYLYGLGILVICHVGTMAYAEQMPPIKWAAPLVEENSPEAAPDSGDVALEERGEAASEPAAQLEINLNFIRPPLELEAERVDPTANLEAYLTPRILLSYLNSLIATDLTAPQSLFDGRAFSPATFMETAFRFLDHLRIDRAILLSTLIYMKRAQQVGFVIGTSNWGRLFLASLFLSIQMEVDGGMPIAEYARLLGMEESDIRSLEVALLHLLNHQLYVSASEAFALHQQLKRIFLELRAQTKQE